MQTAEIASRLKAADPTIVLGPRASDWKLLPITPITAKQISGAEDPELENHFNPYEYD